MDKIGENITSGHPAKKTSVTHPKSGGGHKRGANLRTRSGQTMPRILRYISFQYASTDLYLQVG